MSLLADARHLFGREERDILPLPWKDFMEYFTFNGATYPFMGGSTWVPESLAEAYKRNGVVFACVMARVSLFSEARLTFRRIRNGVPGDLFGTQALSLLEHPWSNASTGDLLTRAIVDVDLTGNFYLARTSGERLVRLRPDWVKRILGYRDSRDQLEQNTVDLLGYWYYPEGPGKSDPIALDVNRVAHWFPTPDPTDAGIGISWVNRVLPQIIAHSRATEHKGKFFEHGATPNTIVTLDPSVKEDSFERWVKKFREGNEGVQNAYKTIFLGGGANAQVVGTNLQQLDFKATQGADETVIAAAAQVPPIIVGLSEGLASATYSNYAQARRRFADMTIRPLWGSFCSSVSKLIRVPPDAQLWYDDRHIPALREDAKDRAEIQGLQSRTIRTLLDAGYDGESVTAAVLAEDWSLLKHSGLFSVQLQPPLPDGPAPDPADQVGRSLVALMEPYLKRKEDAA